MQLYVILSGAHQGDLVEVLGQDFPDHTPEPWATVRGAQPGDGPGTWSEPLANLDYWPDEPVAPPLDDGDPEETDPIEVSWQAQAQAMSTDALATILEGRAQDWELGMYTQVVMREVARRLRLPQVRRASTELRR